ncbi:MAG: DUF29 domain-containing protein [Methylococcales bacterium]|nr:DUF29 domain-containing protein [Methylococcales bacterium]
MNTTLQALYNTDFNSWIQQHIFLLKAGRVNEIDNTHLIEELEDMGKSDTRELKSRLTTLIAHLLKWQFQSDQRSNSWKSSIIEQRTQLSFLLDDSPSLKRTVDDSANKIYSKAREWAIEETGLKSAVFPTNCPYSVEQLFDKDFYPQN